MLSKLFVSGMALTALAAAVPAMVLVIGTVARRQEMDEDGEESLSSGRVARKTRTGDPSPPRIGGLEKGGGRRLERRHEQASSWDFPSGTGRSAWESLR
jgi:hypothetical protein